MCILPRVSLPHLQVPTSCPQVLSPPCVSRTLFSSQNFPIFSRALSAPIKFSNPKSHPSIQNPQSSNEITFPFPNQTPKVVEFPKLKWTSISSTRHSRESDSPRCPNEKWVHDPTLNPHNPDLLQVSTIYHPQHPQQVPPCLSQSHSIHPTLGLPFTFTLPPVYTRFSPKVPISPTFPPLFTHTFSHFQTVGNGP